MLCSVCQRCHVATLCAIENYSGFFFTLVSRVFIVGWEEMGLQASTRVGTLIVATIYLHLIQKRYMFRSFTVLQCSHQHCVQPVASDVEVVGYL